MSGTPDRRRHPRASLALAARVFGEHGELGCFRLRNLSASGALLEGAPLPEVGETLRIVLTLKPALGVTVEALVLRRSRPDEGEPRFAVAFGVMAADAEEAIRQTVAASLQVARRATALMVGQSEELDGALRTELRGRGYFPLTLATPLEAIGLLGDENRVRVALVEVGLPADGARLLVDYLCERHPQVRRVLVSPDDVSGAFASTVPAPLCAAAHAVVTKPWSGKSLDTALGADGSVQRQHPG
jgi:hypothetical protein